jgi:hypothetical protein
LLLDLRSATAEVEEDGAEEREEGPVCLHNLFR